jgi:hypothetical protein
LHSENQGLGTFRAKRLQSLEVVGFEHTQAEAELNYLSYAMLETLDIGHWTLGDEVISDAFVQVRCIDSHHS